MVVPLHWKARNSNLIRANTSIENVECQLYDIDVDWKGHFQLKMSSSKWKSPTFCQTLIHLHMPGQLVKKHGLATVHAVIHFKLRCKWRKQRLELKTSSQCLQLEDSVVFLGVATQGSNGWFIRASKQLHCYCSDSRNGIEAAHWWHWLLFAELKQYHVWCIFAGIQLSLLPQLGRLKCSFAREKTYPGYWFMDTLALLCLSSEPLENTTSTRPKLDAQVGWLWLWRY